MRRSVSPIQHLYAVERDGRGMNAKWSRPPSADVNLFDAYPQRLRSYFSDISTKAEHSSYGVERLPIPTLCDNS